MRPKATYSVVALSGAVLVLGVLWFAGGERAATPLPESGARPAGSAADPQLASPEPREKRYLFDMVTHSAEEILELLTRAAEMSEAASVKNETIQIAMVLHGPDIDFFSTSNYEKYRTIVDLAAELDAGNIIDFKACQSTANKLGLDAGDLPDFIEMVPYAPDAIDELEDHGYVTL